MPASDGSSWLRTIGIVTTTRADYGIYRPLLRALAAAGRYRLTRFAGGTHLRDEFGSTISEIGKEPFGDIVEVDYFVPGDDAAAIAASAGAALTAFGRMFAERPVDLLFLLGDRYEMLSAATAALLHHIPIAHLHGGDITAGSLDDSIRNAITKLAALHFPALPAHAERIRRMGENDSRIFVTGALALDELAAFKPEPSDAVSSALGLDVREPTAVICLHPETLGSTSPNEQFRVMADALGGFAGNVVVVGSNADEGHLQLRKEMEQFIAARPNARLVLSMPQARFWSCLHHAALFIGNSSAGIIEAASLKLPVVNVGTRQGGRLHAENVIDMPQWDASLIATAIRRAASPEFRASLANLKNPWGDGRAAGRIVAALAGLPEKTRLLAKSQD